MNTASPTAPDDQLQVLAGLFIDDIELRPVPGPSTRIDLGGVQFSAPMPGTSTFTWAPHLVVIVRAPASHSGNGVLEVIFTRDGEQVARNVQPIQVDPGKFSYRLVRAEVEIAEPCTIEAHVKLDQGVITIVPFNHLAPVADPPAGASAAGSRPIADG